MKVFTKIVIRKLPKKLSEDEFRVQIQPYCNFNYFCFCPAELHHGNYGSCRAYLEFTNEDEMYSFQRDMECKLFTDSEGNQSFGIIEFAVYQKVPVKTKIDIKENTIEKDVDFIKFKKEEEARELAPATGNLSVVEANLEELRVRDNDRKTGVCTRTPLLEYLSTLGKKEPVVTSAQRHHRPHRAAAAISSKAEPEVRKKKEDKGNKIGHGHHKPAVSIANKRSDIQACAAAYEVYDAQTSRPVGRHGGWADGGGKNRVRRQQADYGDYYSDYYGSNRTGGPKKASTRRPPAYSATRKD